MISTILALLLNTTVMAGSAPLEITGKLLFSYKDMQDDQFVNLEPQGWRFDQVTLGLKHDFIENISGFVRLSNLGAGFTINEAYISATGAPFEWYPRYATLTLGRFHGPRAAPYRFINLTFSELSLFAFPMTGLKLNLDHRSWDIEAGLVNSQALGLPAQSALVAGTAVFSNVAPVGGVATAHVKDVYIRLSRRGITTGIGRFSGGATFLSGRLSSTEIDMLNPGGAVDLGLYSTTRMDSKKRYFLSDLEWTDGPFRAFAEYIKTTDGRLHRRIITALGSYTIPLKTGSITATLGYDRLEKDAEIELFNNPISWDRERRYFNASWRPVDRLEIQAQYEKNRENVSNPRRTHVDNDVIAVQSIVSF